MSPETFIEHFETFAAAPNGVAKLRELILPLAVQGKLGTQDDGDALTDFSQSDNTETFAVGSLLSVDSSRNGSTSTTAT